MKRYLILPALVNLMIHLLMPINAKAVNLASTPLASASNSAATPNIMFILDDSFSMTNTYMPDWVGSDFCWNSVSKKNDGECGGLNVFLSSDFNSLYYNPAIRYQPARNADGSSKPSLDTQAEWETAKNDAYSTIDMRTTNLVGNAKYFTLQAGEYCNSKKLNQCVQRNTPTGDYIYPAKVRFCKDEATAVSSNNPAKDYCQATIDSGHRAAGLRFYGRGAAPGALVRTDIVVGQVYDKTVNRTDCAGSKCTYTEEMTNFANWHTYYRTRLQAMKTATSIAFSSIDSRYRVGYNVINYDGINDNDGNQGSPNKFLHIDTFDSAHKLAFYDRLFKAQPALKMRYTYPGGSAYTYRDELHFTPLRGALSRAGKIYANKIEGINDPIQHACQANYTLLSTDGYWNGQEDRIAGDQPETATFGPYIETVTSTGASTKVGNRDAVATTSLPKREGELAPNTLADVAKYYYDTDLRNSTLNNCINADNVDVCGTSNSKLKQNMTTFTLGLGIDGTLLYSDDYKTATSGDYYDLKTGQGTAIWESPFKCSDYCGERVDDLWHAAVNGNGTYYSAKNPQMLVEGLSSALSEIYARSNAGSAASTTSLSPVAGNNNAFVASYTSTEWNGNLESRSIDTSSGHISKTAKWCVENVAIEPCSMSIFISDTNNSRRTYCAPAGTATYSDSMEISGVCTGSLKAKISSNGTDTRKILIAKGSALVDFTYANLSTPQKSYFQTAYLSREGGLSQWSALTTEQKGLATEGNLIKYLRGHSTYEDKDSNTNRLFRYREKVLGDITESNPVYVGAPNFNYLESSYVTFKERQSARPKIVYVGANDGMLHAFNANDVTERWAYIPSILIPKLSSLADKAYAGKHQNFVNGSITVTDICKNFCTSADEWKTILVGGLGEGGKGFYALNVTDTDKPEFLWEFNNAELGYSFGNPVITKQRDGKWVVLLTSGYNNTGKDYLYVLDANTGEELRRIPTPSLTDSSPRGLAKISAFVARPSENNQADYAYGGDLLGKLWRFKIDSVESATNPNNPVLLANLKDKDGDVQPITARPELGKISGKTVVFIGTGKYLEKSDLTTTQTQTLYAIKDSSMTLNRPNLEPRTISSETGSDMRTGSIQDNAFENKNGWFIDLPDSGERQIVSAKLASGTLVVPTMVPSANECSPNGYGWINYFQAATGGIVSTTVANRIGTKTDAAPAGINILYIDGKPTLSVTADNDPTPKLDPNAPFKIGGSFAGKRASWRELIR